VALCCRARVSAPRCVASPSRTQPLPIGPPRRRAPLLAAAPRIARAHRLPCRSPARHARATCAARRCPSNPDPPHTCCAGSRGVTVRPVPLRSYPTPTRHRADPPPSFFPRRSAPERVQKRWPSSCSPLCSAFLPRAQAHRRLPRPPLTRSIGLRRQDRNGPRHISDRRHRCPPPPPTVRPNHPPRGRGALTEKLAAG
jgi:hypothetical protein